MLLHNNKSVYVCKGLAVDPASGAKFRQGFTKSSKKRLTPRGQVRKKKKLTSNPGVADHPMGKTVNEPLRE